jgi:protocatechuate 3,4-dioxygenase alpha subunit
MSERRPPTPSQTVGPFFGFGLPFEAGERAVDAGDADAVQFEGQVLDGESRPVEDALLEVWQGRQFARTRTDREGAFSFTVAKPPAGVADGAREAPHLNVYVFARGLLRQLATRIYFPDEERANDEDPVLQRVEPDRRRTLVAVPTETGLRFDIHLQGEEETVFFAL